MMNKNLKASKSIVIKANADKVWETMTTPEKIKIYLFGTETITDWKVGSPIIFQGEYDGHQYKDKGNVLENIPKKLLKYAYWSGFSGLEDIPDNYSVITYKIEESSNNSVIFSWTQEGFANEEGQQHSESGLYAMLEQIKEIAEKANI
jgi:uncharacterized protein YndB with AHSA1/START domain